MNVETGRETTEFVRAAGGSADFIRADVTRATDVGALIDATIAAHHRLDCAFNNAGIAGPIGSLTHEYPDDGWDHVIAVNLKGVWQCMRYEIPHMLSQGGGAIVNNASIWGLVGAPGAAAYVASKHGVAGLTRATALEYAAKGIRINAVNPGTIRTPILDPFVAAMPDFVPVMTAKHPIGHIGLPEEVAEVVVWLCSDAASFVVGQTCRWMAAIRHSDSIEVTDRPSWQGCTEREVLTEPRRNRSQARFRTRPIMKSIRAEKVSARIDAGHRQMNRIRGSRPCHE